MHLWVWVSEALCAGDRCAGYARRAHRDHPHEADWNGRRRRRRMAVRLCPSLRGTGHTDGGKSSGSAAAASASAAADASASAGGVSRLEVLFDYGTSTPQKVSGRITRIVFRGDGEE